MMIALGGTLTVPGPASAVGACAAVSPSRRSDGSYDLLVDTYGKSYKGKPFTFSISTHGRGIFPMTQTWTYFYFKQPRSMHTPVLKGVRAYRLAVSWEGRECSKWYRYGF